MTDFDVVVIGAGVVGLACAAELAARGMSVLIVERHATVGHETSSRNSGVIHAGIYYPTSSLKALLCVRGRALLYERCQREGIAHRKTGKLIVATTDAEAEQLYVLHARGRDNDAGGLELISEVMLQSIEPNVTARLALSSPETGIVDATALTRSYLHDATQQDAMIALRTQVIDLQRVSSRWCIDTQSDDGSTSSVRSTWVINAAGLGADRIATIAGIDVDRVGYRQHPCKGDYFALSPRLAGITRHLVYPVPAAAGLGVHVTFDLGGKWLAGPDATYVDAVDYRVDADKAAQFAAALQRYLPSVRAEDLAADYAGIRPKLQGPGDSFRDFVIEDAVTHGMPGLINLVGIESPGLTASAAIAEHVATLI